MDEKLVKKNLDLHPRTTEKWIEYGTAGFRTRSEDLDHVMFRVGVIADIRSKFLKNLIGLVITASHNEENDNGVKIVDPDGGMMEAEWEMIVTRLANVADEDFIQAVSDLMVSLEIDAEIPGIVAIGRDTRRSSPILAASAIDGVKSLGGEILDFNVTTTPQLHYLVVCLNNNLRKPYGYPSVDAYFSKFANGFLKIRKAAGGGRGNYVGKVFLDAANGVGADAAKHFASLLKGELDIEIFNSGDGVLNYQCGADFVKINQKPPVNSPEEPNLRCISIDGDADRIVYYYLDGEKRFHLLDGDKIATLAVAYLKELIDASKLDINLGLVQTAYANGASTKYVSNSLKVPVACTNTGVKYLHSEAKKFDIGVYFEANGHGTVLFNRKTKKLVRKVAEDDSDPESQKAAFKLASLIDTVNQLVGDALTDMLLVETILFEKGWDISTWEQCYSDLPNKQLKVKVKDRKLIKTADAERKCVSPDGLQQRINEIVANYPQGRSFIRPSGTEDIVRVYAECEDPDLVSKLASEVADAVAEFTGND